MQCRAIALGVALVLPGCLAPPMNVGYVAMDPSRRGGVDVQGQVGVGGALPSGPVGGGSTIHVEPFAGPKLSVPIGLGLAGSTEGGVAPLRIGVRHRARRFLAWGGGIGPAINFSDLGAFPSGVADLELVLGMQRPWGGLSVGMRPTVSFDAGFAMFYALVDPTIAFVVAPQTSLTIALPMGGFYTGYGGGVFMTGALGIHRAF